MALVRAWNTRRNHWQDVPAHYIGSERVFPGVFVKEPPTEPVAPTSRANNSRRKAGSTAENTPATTEAAATNEPTPLAGEENKE